MTQPQSLAAAQEYISWIVAKPAGRRGRVHGQVVGVDAKIRADDGSLLRGLFYRLRYSDGTQEHVTWKDLERALVASSPEGKAYQEAQPRTAQSGRRTAAAAPSSNPRRSQVLSSSSSDISEVNLLHSSSSDEEQDTSKAQSAPAAGRQRQQQHSARASVATSNGSSSSEADGSDSEPDVDRMDIDQHCKGRRGQQKQQGALKGKPRAIKGPDQGPFSLGQAAAHMSAALHVTTPAAARRRQQQQRAGDQDGGLLVSPRRGRSPAAAGRQRQQQQEQATPPRSARTKQQERQSPEPGTGRRATRSVGASLDPGLCYFTSAIPPAAGAGRGPGPAAAPASRRSHRRSALPATANSSSSSSTDDSSNDADSSSGSSDDEDSVRQATPRGQQQQRRQQQQQQQRRTPTAAASSSVHIVTSSDGSSGSSSSDGDTSSEDEEEQQQPCRGVRCRWQPSPCTPQATSGRSRRPAASAAAAGMAATPATGRKSKPASTPATRKAATTAAAAAAVERTPAPAARRTRAAASSGMPAAAAVATPFTAAAGARGAGRAALQLPPGAAPGTLQLGGEVFAPGDDVYLALPGYTWREEQDEPCEVCGSTALLTGMLECSCCLRGFHLRCLKPPLKKVPEGDWLCPACDAGELPPRPSQLVTHWQRLLYGDNELELAHIVGVTRGVCPKGVPEDQVLVRYYVRPEQTHIGRQRHHGARELFLGTQVFVEPALCLVRRAWVHGPAAFATAADSEQGNDVFLCQYEYDLGWKRFRQREYGPGQKGASGLQDWAWSGPGGPAFDAGLEGEEQEFSSGEEDLYQPDRPAWVGRAGGAGRGQRRQGLKRSRQGAPAPDGRFTMLGCSEAPQQVAPQDPYSRVLGCLALSAVPSVLPGREAEKAVIRSFVEGVSAGEGGIQYICGVPGTGKTACVMEVLAAFRAEQQEEGPGAATATQLVVLNCLQLPTPHHVFTRLWEKLSGQRLGPARAREALKQAFGIGQQQLGLVRRRYSTLVVLDEIDMLLTRDHGVLYELFDWPQQQGSRLGIIGISNTHDLDERVLPRIKSRLSEAKLLFQPYLRQQLEAIVTERLGTSGAAGLVDGVAVGFACTAVARQSGDARRALELLRRAVQLSRAALPPAQQAALAAATKAGTSSTAAAADGAGASSSRHNATPGTSSKRQKATGSKVAASPVAGPESVWSPGKPALVTHQHVAAANQEMANALHMQLLKGCSTWQLLLLLGVVVEARATGQLVVCLESVAERVAGHLSTLVQVPSPTEGQLQRCAVQLAAQRLLVMQGSTIKCSLMLNVRKEDVAAVVRDDDKLTRLHELM